MNWHHLKRIVWLSFRIIGYLATLLLLFLLAKGCLNLVESFSSPFGFSKTMLSILEGGLLLLFLFISIQLIIHFFNSHRQ